MHSTCQAPNSIKTKLATSCWTVWSIQQLKSHKLSSNESWCCSVCAECIYRLNLFANTHSDDIIMSLAKKSCFKSALINTYILILISTYILDMINESIVSLVVMNWFSLATLISIFPRCGKHLSPCTIYPAKDRQVVKQLRIFPSGVSREREKRVNAGLYQVERNTASVEL